MVKEKKKPMNKKVVYGTIVALALVAVLITYLTFGNDDVPVEGVLEIISIEELESSVSITNKLRSQFDIDRSEYGLGQIAIFEPNGTRVWKTFRIADTAKYIEEECGIPEEFWRMKMFMMEGRITQAQLASMSECVYNQPEFIRDNFERICIPRVFKEPDLTHWTPNGYGGYPSETVLYANPGEIHKVYGFLHAGCGVENYQGLRMIVEYPTTGRDADAKKVIVDSEASQQYLNVTVSPRDILLSPSYPIYTMGWTRKIELTISVESDAPPGVYSTGWTAAGADAEKEAEWLRIWQEKYSPKAGIEVEPRMNTVSVVVT